MRKNRVEVIEDAFVYVTDCNLATVSYMAMLKRKTKSEYERQKSIAQFMVDIIVNLNLNSTGIRADEIIKNNLTVDEWAKKWEPPK